MQAVGRHGRDWVAVSRDVGSKTRIQCFRKFNKEVAAGRMQEPGGKQKKESWSQAELIQLKAAVDRHGCDWVAVSRDVGSKTAQQCQHKVSSEIAAGRIPYGRVSPRWLHAVLPIEAFVGWLVGCPVGSRPSSRLSALVAAGPRRAALGRGPRRRKRP